MNDLFFWACVGVIGGIIWFFKGFRHLQKKRLIENIPTSKIRSMALGLVEIKGKALDLAPLTAPFTHKPCVYYRYVIEELRQSNKSSRWVTVQKGDSCNSPFYVEDDTGRALINAAGAEIEIPHDFRLQTSIFGEVPDAVTKFLDARGINHRSFFGLQKTMRFTEFHIAPGDEVFIIGTCKSNQANLAQLHQQKLVETLRLLKSNPALLEKFDADNDGKISAEEWEIARQSVEKRLEVSTSRDGTQADRVYVGAAQGRDAFFYISDRSENEVVSKLNFAALSGVCLGPLCAIFSLGYLLYTFSKH